jgi:hypothetical protein
MIYLGGFLGDLASWRSHPVLAVAAVFPLQHPLRTGLSFTIISDSTKPEQFGYESASQRQTDLRKLQDCSPQRRGAGDLHQHQA